jgi:hypothetical protein
MILGVEWNEGEEVLYSDRKIDGEEYPYPFVVSLGRFDTSTTFNGSSDTQTTSVILNDIDGSLKNITNTIDIHKRKASIYLCFAGLPITEKVLLFSGQINSPIIWDEAVRTLGFDILSKIEDTEVAFTMEDSEYFPFVPPADRNKVWPLVFGHVCHMQGVPVTALRKGFLAEGVGVKDPTLEERLCQANKLKCASKEAPSDTNDTPHNTQGSRLVSIAGPNNKKYVVDQQCVTRRFNEICAILFDRAQQDQYVKTKFDVRGGGQFPQNQLIEITINGVRFEGIMNGEEFTVQNVYHPALDEIDNPVCQEISNASRGFRDVPDASSRSWSISGSGSTATYIGAALTSPLTCTDGSGLSLRETTVNGAGASWEYYEQFEKGNFIWLPPGSNVFLTSESEIINIVSLIPGSVSEVAAYRNFGDTSLLVEVPTDLYEVHTIDYEGYDVVEVRLNKKLSLIEDQAWEDDIFVSFESSVGPNPVDAIEYLVGKYTDLTIDTATFDTVRASLENYPANFYVKTRPSVLSLIKDIAFQFRCAAVVRNNIISLVYLSKEPPSVRTIREEDIIVNTFRVSFTETEDLITRHEITWRQTDAPVNKNDDPDFTFVLKQNIPKYGVNPESYHYFTQNTFETVLKSATFWMIRKCNTWKYIEFETTLKHLDLEIFDCIILSIDQFAGTKAIVVDAKYNADTNTIGFKCWTPILSGTNSMYQWAWPALQNRHARFPLVGSDQSGDGYEFIVRPPEDHPLAGGFDPDAAQVWSDGDLHPSDIDDDFPLFECDLATDADIAEDLEPVIEAFEPLAEKQFEDRQTDFGSGTSGGGGGGGDDKEEKGACGKPNTGQTSCVYEVRINYVTPTLVGNNKGPDPPQGCAGPCIGASGTEGLVCAGPITQQCHTFSALFAATSYQTTVAASIKRCPSGGVKGIVGVTSVYGIGGIKAIPCDDCVLGECDDVSGVGNPSVPGADSGETTQAKTV